MHNTALAEWTLARFTNKPHAAAILGDLEEASATKGNAWFWRSYLRILLACAWRPLVAYLVVVWNSGQTTKAFLLLSRYGARTHSESPLYSGWLGLFLVMAVPAFTTVTIYALIRFGPRDVVARLAVAYLILGFYGISLWWLPALHVCAAIAAIVLLLISMFSSGGRRGFASLTMMALVPPVIFFVFMATCFAVVKIGGYNTIPTAGVPFAGPILTLISCVLFGRIHRAWQKADSPAEA